VAHACRSLDWRAFVDVCAASLALPLDRKRRRPHRRRRPREGCISTRSPSRTAIGPSTRRRSCRSRSTPLHPTIQSRAVMPLRSSFATARMYGAQLLPPSLRSPHSLLTCLYAHHAARVSQVARHRDASISDGAARILLSSRESRRHVCTTLHGQVVRRFRYAHSLTALSLSLSLSLSRCGPCTYMRCRFFRQRSGWCLHRRVLQACVPARDGSHSTSQFRGHRQPVQGLLATIGYRSNLVLSR